MPANTCVKRALNSIENYPSKILNVTYNGNPITLKQYIPRSEAQTSPSLSLSTPTPAPATSTTYLLIMLDLDAPFPSLPHLGPFLHWIQPGYTANPTGLLTTTSPFIANYIGPAPPPGSAPHRYSFYVFEQPADFDAGKYAPAAGKPLSLWYRMRFDLDGWQKMAGLGEPVAVNYFLSN
ncbi:hypothetical protein BHYA_0259g00060 [Botrytis hyacinthi]|uniref:PEBP-like protein n=1 Tax=Botrytis hyacinthi TaxID=278943 RepID=A0A4Z1G8B7_9HELO|nr:hypothetical protein BHYA_0259g00060 [Botrytis hyacinthi]